MERVVRSVGWELSFWGKTDTVFLLFGEIKSAVGASEKFAEGLFLVQKTDGTETTGDILDAREADEAGLQIFAETSQNRGRDAPVLHVGQEEHKFVAAEANQNVVVSEIVAGGFADELQDGVAYEVTVGVVDGLEIVNVENDKDRAIIGVSRKVTVNGALAGLFLK